MKTENCELFDEIKRIVISHVDGYDLDKIKISPLSGLTNETFKIKCEGKQSLLFRKFGGNFNRDIENQIFKALQEAQIAPKCYFACQDYRIELFIRNASHPTLTQLSNSSLKKKIFEVMHKYHQSEIQILKNRPLFIEEIFSKKYLQKIMSHKAKSNDPKFKELFQVIQAQYKKIDQLRSEFIEPNKQKAKKKIRFCHNDLNNLNIFSKPEVMLIDYEYSSYNYFYYDIADFINECTINYQINQSPYFRIQKRISLQDIQNDVKLYPERYPDLQKDVLKGLLACNLYWATWSVIMAFDPSQGNFGTIQHGLARMELYRYYKDFQWNENTQ